MLDPKIIIDINTEIAENSFAKKNLVESALSSYLYYETDELKISSIILGLIRNHPFTDGNKRTALCVLYLLSETYSLKLIEDQKLFNVIISIATNKQSVEQIASSLFKNN